MEKCDENPVGVFGDEINYNTLKEMPEYKDKTNITRADLAKVARERQHIGGYDDACLDYVVDMKVKYGHGISTKCMVYNATGGDLTFVLTHNFYGDVFCNPYPTIIKNGQWGGWLHVHDSSCPIYGSRAGVVYRGRNNGGTKMDWLLTWYVPSSGSHKVYTEIGGRKHYDDPDTANWDSVYDKLATGKLNSELEHNGCRSDTTIESNDDITAEYYATMTLTDP